jgi:hypothetical protein
MKTTSDVLMVLDPDDFNPRHGILTRYGKRTSMTKRQKIVTTLITDKILQAAFFKGAHHCHNWTWDENTNVYETNIFSRMSKICYSQCFHTKSSRHVFNQKQKLLPNMKIKPTVFNHIIYCAWKEPFGQGTELKDKSTDPMDFKYEKTGKWHKIWDLGLEIILWHPSQQPRTEALMGSNSQICRPIYDFSKEEVIKSLQFMCEVFKLKFEEGENTAARFRFTI